VACTLGHIVQLRVICLSRSHQFNSERYYAFTRFHFHPRMRHGPRTGYWCCLPVFFRCMTRGCSRFPPSCSGTPATSVCCSSPGLGSFLRPRSAASWAPRIGRRTETGTYFNKNTLTSRNDQKYRKNRCRKISSLREDKSALLEEI